MKKKRYRWWYFPPMAALWGFGLRHTLKSAASMTRLNGGVFLGILMMAAAVYLTILLLYLESTRLGRPLPKLLNGFLPDCTENDVPTVPDISPLMVTLSAFRASVRSFFLEAGIPENSALQSHSTQLLWHSLLLQKRRLNRLGLTMELQSERKDYCGNPKSTVHEDPFFDGRYQVNEVDEMIAASRDFLREGVSVGKVLDKENAHYSILSAGGNTDGSLVVCPNCGRETSRENLIDGCDYCGTRFTVEDLENRVGAFGFREEYRAKNSKANDLADRVGSWVSSAVSIFAFHVGFMVPFIYTSGTNLIGRLFVCILGMLAAVLASGLFSFVLISLLSIPFSRWQRKLLNGEILMREQDIRRLEEPFTKSAREHDPLFSLKSMYAGIQNKLTAIHFADSALQVDAFSEADLTSCLDSYRNVVSMDVDFINPKEYRAGPERQTAKVGMDLILLEFDGERITRRSESVNVTLEKAASCRTQAVCAPSVLTCRGCGSSLSLMDGKRCAYCGRELDLSRYDWVITEYRSVLRDPEKVK